jgi:hypothetical protein
VPDEVEDVHRLHEVRHPEKEPLHRLLPCEVPPALEALDVRGVGERLRPVRRHHVTQGLVGLEPPDDDQDLLDAVAATQPAPSSRH